MGPFVYILASKRNGTLYVGVTTNLGRRMFEHKNGLLEGFTSKYGVTRLVYVEKHERVLEAVRREAQIKKWRRLWKLRLIESRNPDWIDLAEQPGFW
jgi:putative endonuclease